MASRKQEALSGHTPEALADRAKILEYKNVDLIAGGFPCQDISDAGRCTGITGSRSGLWKEMVRTIRMVEPKYVLVENVAALLHRGMGTVLGDLADGGYDSEWDCIPAGAFGAPHIRNRVFVVANAPGDTKSSSFFPPGKEPEGVFNVESRRGFGVEVPGSYWQSDQPSFHQMDDGFPGWVGDVSGYGNAVVPDVAEWIGRRIIERSSA